MNIMAESFKDRLRQLGKTLKYSLYVIFHPFDGFWDLIHEKRGSMGAAHTIIILVVLTQIWTWTYSAFPTICLNGNISTYLCGFYHCSFVYYMVYS